MTTLDAAIEYVRRGWKVVPIPFRSKNPGFKGWPALRLSENELQKYFNGQPQNIGVLLGKPSRWLIDVDLDHPRAVQLAAEYLPPTPLIFGRAGKRQSHWLYEVTAPVKTQKYRSKSDGMIAELRSTGCQTVVPPSTHECGEPIYWLDNSADAARVDPLQLMPAVERLVVQVRTDLGETIRKVPSVRNNECLQSLTPDGSVSIPARIERCLSRLLLMDMTDHKDGSNRLFTACCRAIEYDLNDADAISVVRRYEQVRPFHRIWSDQDICKRLRDAERSCSRGNSVRTQMDATGLVQLGTHDPMTGRLVLSPSRTLPTALSFVEEFYSHLDGPTLYSHAGTLLVWRSNRYEELEKESLYHQLQCWLHEALRYSSHKKTGDLQLVPFDSNPRTIIAAAESVRNYVHLPATTTPPNWLVTGDDRSPPTELLPFRTGILHVPSGRVLAATPSLFNVNSVDFDYDPNAKSPQRWLQFLDELWNGDLESKQLLQEWMGYSLVGDTSQQKILLVVGPKRSGKGTIGRVLTRLVGARNVVGPTVSSLAMTFGLQPLIGKSLAIVSDACFSGTGVGVAIERLKCISGEDSVTIDRKFLSSCTMKLPTRFVFLTNELPRLKDASAAIASRFVILRLTRNFYGCEDRELCQKLCDELPDILLWAIEGLKRLHMRGHFIQPSAVADAVLALEDLASPTLAFIRDYCSVGSRLRIWVDDLYAAWKKWCECEGRTSVTTKQTFGRDLAAAAPGVVRRRGARDRPFYEGIALREGVV